MKQFLSRAARKTLGAVSAPVFRTEDVQVGSGVKFGRNVVFNCDRVRIGDGTVIGDDVVFDASDVQIGDFATIYRRCHFPGPGTLVIGHNFWLGDGCIVDSQGGTTIGNNVGVGAQSQLWTHMKFGDVMMGCRFHSAAPLVVEDDAWLVGHCLISPVRIGARAVAMLGSVVTRDLESDRTYAGVPAKDMTHVFGPQFEATTPDQRRAWLESRLAELAKKHELPSSAIVLSRSEAASVNGKDVILNVADRTYVKQGTPQERRLLRLLLPDAKFLPVHSP